MIRIQISNPTISSYQIEKASGRKNIGLWLASKNITNWSYSWSKNIFVADVPDNFDTSVLSVWGTVIIIPSVE